MNGATYFVAGDGMLLCIHHDDGTDTAYVLYGKDDGLLLCERHFAGDPDAAIVKNSILASDLPNSAPMPMQTITGQTASMLSSQVSMTMQTYGSPAASVMRQHAVPGIYFVRTGADGDGNAQVLFGYVDENQGHHVAVCSTMAHVRAVCDEFTWRTIEQREELYLLVAEKGLPQRSDAPPLRIGGLLAAACNHGDQLTRRLERAADEAFGTADDPTETEAPPDPAHATRKLDPTLN